MLINQTKKINKGMTKTSWLGYTQCVCNVIMNNYKILIRILLMFISINKQLTKFIISYYKSIIVCY